MNIHTDSHGTGQGHDDRFRDCLADVARHFFGPTNKKLSRMHELRFNARGSKSVDLRKGTWYDHETGEGGGTIALVMREMKFATRAEAAAWLEAQGFIESSRRYHDDSDHQPKANGKKRAHGDSFPGLGTPAKVYDYPDPATGKTIHQNCRFVPKNFRPRQPDGNGSWYWDLQGLDDKLVLYRQAEIAEAIAAGRPIYLCEGEKDVEAAVAINLDATCCQGGSGGWRPQYNAAFKGADLIIIPHNDEAGRKFAEKRAAELKPLAARVRILRLWESWQDCREKGDLYDWLQVPKHTREAFDLLVDALPDYEPEDDITPPTERNTDLGNARRLVRLHGDDLRYVHPWRSWLIWRDGHWRRDEDQAVMRRAKATIEAMFEEAQQINDETRRNALRGWAVKSQEGKRLREMIALAQSEIKVVLPVNAVDADPYLLGVQNGIIELRTGTFREARREDYVTKFAGAGV